MLKCYKQVERAAKRILCSIWTLLQAEAGIFPLANENELSIWVIYSANTVCRLFAQESAKLSREKQLKEDTTLSFERKTRSFKSRRKNCVSGFLMYMNPLNLLGISFENILLVSKCCYIDFCFTILFLIIFFIFTVTLKGCPIMLKHKHLPTCKGLAIDRKIQM